MYAKAKKTSAATVNMRIAFDVIGSGDKAVAIIEPKEGENPKDEVDLHQHSFSIERTQKVRETRKPEVFAEAKTIAEEIMQRHSNVKSVLAKVSGRTGKFRTCKLKLIIGDKNTEVLHKEHGMLFKIDPAKVYFSPRESQERQEIAALVRPKEKVLVLFSGVGPFAIAVAKKQSTAQVVAVDANKAAIKYADENRRLNRTWNVENICADAEKFSSKEKFDRIIMPLPETAWKFLPAAKKLAKKNAIIHLYAIGSDAKSLKDIDEKLSKGMKILRREKVLPFAPHKWKIRIDLKF